MRGMKCYYHAATECVPARTASGNREEHPEARRKRTMIILDVMDFDEGMLSVFDDFDCRTPYDPKNYEVELNDWARTESTKWLKYGTKVWLYFLPGTKRLVGYSSL